MQSKEHLLVGLIVVLLAVLFGQAKTDYTAQRNALYIKSHPYVVYGTNESGANGYYKTGFGYKNR